MMPRQPRRTRWAAVFFTVWRTLPILRQRNALRHVRRAGRERNTFLQKIYRGHGNDNEPSGSDVARHARFVSEKAKREVGHSAARPTMRGTPRFFCKRQACGVEDEAFQTENIP